MIKVYRTPKPQELTVETQRRLTKKFIDENKNVWTKPYIRKSLLKMSNSKCVYCESLINEESKYMEVEHFYPKNEYPGSVVDWDNLLPSCKRCNGKKGFYDTGVSPFIHPVNDMPNEHLTLRSAGRVVGTDDKGRASVQELGLNDYDMIRKPRVRVIQKLSQDLDDLHEELSNRSLHNDFVFQKKVQRKMRAILQTSSPRSAYSAYVSCEVLRHPFFSEIAEVMREHNIWNSSHEKLFQQAKHIAFQVND